MRLVFGISVLIGVLLLPRVSRGASLESKPAGVHVTVSGRVRLAGVTPLPLDDLPPGEYRIQARGRGTALARGRLVRDSNSYVIKPSASAMALLLPPGIIHVQQHETGRGLLFLGGGLAGATMTVVNEASRSDAQENVDIAQKLYELAVTEDDIIAARLALEHARDETDDEAEMRNLWLFYGGAAWVGAAVEQWLLTPHATLDAKSEALNVPRAGGPAAGLRSALVPGAGQRYVGRSGRGNLLLTSVMGLGALTLVAHESYLGARRDQTDAQRRYIAATTEEDLNHWRAKLEDAAHDADSKNTLQWTFVGLTAGAYLWNVVDAWFIGGRIGSDAPLDMSVLPRSDGVEASLTWRMP